MTKVYPPTIDATGQVQSPQMSDPPRDAITHGGRSAEGFAPARLEDAYGSRVEVVGLTIGERETIVRALEDPPAGLEQLRGGAARRAGRPPARLARLRPRLPWSSVVTRLCPRDRTRSRLKSPRMRPSVLSRLEFGC